MELVSNKKGRKDRTRKEGLENSSHIGHIKGKRSSVQIFWRLFRIAGNISKWKKKVVK